MNFKKGINKNQEYLFAKKPEDFLPEDHFAKAIYEVAEHLDLSKIESKYSKIGQNAYNPKMMTKLIFNGYSIGIRSSRKIAKACEERFDFVYLADGLKPSHDRISDFRKDNLEELKETFREIVVIGFNLGLVKLGNINTSIDGTKVRANASAKLTKDEEELKKQKEQMKKKIKEQKKREPTQRELTEIEETKINVTDHDAKFMKERSGVIKPNYNAQISVDEENQFILANDVTDECNDAHQLVPMISQTKQNSGKAPKKVKVDNGYYPQLEEARKLFPEVDLYIDDPKRREEKLDLEKIKEKYSEVQYENLKKLLTDEGYNEYKKRMHTAEPPIGDMKYNYGYRHFLLRGLKKVKGEFNLMCIAHNIKKILRFVIKNDIDLALALKNIKDLIKNDMINGVNY